MSVFCLSLSPVRFVYRLKTSDAFFVSIKSKKEIFLPDLSSLLISSLIFVFFLNKKLTIPPSNAPTITPTAIPTGPANDPARPNFAPIAPPATPPDAPMIPPPTNPPPNSAPIPPPIDRVCFLAISPIPDAPNILAIPSRPP